MKTKTKMLMLLCIMTLSAFSCRETAKTDREHDEHMESNEHMDNSEHMIEDGHNNSSHEHDNNSENH